MGRSLIIAVDACVRSAMASAWSQVIELTPREAVGEVRRSLLKSTELAGERFLRVLGESGSQRGVDFRGLAESASDTCQRQLERAYVHAYLLLPPSRQVFTECDTFVRRAIERALADASEDIQFVSLTCQ